MTKRIIALLLGVMMIFSVAGCGKEEVTSTVWEYEYEDVYEDGETDASAASDVTESGKGNDKNNNSGDGKVEIPDGYTQNTGDKNLDGNTYKTGFPIVKEKETITIMMVTRSDVGDITDSDFIKTYSKLTNMDIKLQLVTEGAARERAVLALQSGNLPDIFCLGPTYITDADVANYGPKGTLIEIKKDMLEKWAPNVVATYNKNPEIWNSLKVDGKMYSVGSFTKDLPYGEHFLWIRTTWLSKLNMNKPTTMDEFYNFLNKVKTTDLDGNGSNDQIPYATWTDGGFSLLPWGLSNTKIVVDNSGKVNVPFATDNMKNALTYWNKVYKENLVDKNTINKWAGDNAAFKTLISGGKVGAFYWGYPSFMADSLLKEYEAIAWPTSGDDNGNYPKVAVNYNSVSSPNGFFITKKCKNVSAALRFIDYLYTNDGYMLKAFGNEGGAYTKVNDTTYKMTGKTIAQNKMGPNWTLKGRHYLDGAALQGNDSLVTGKRATAISSMESIMKSSGQKNMPNAFMTKSESQNISRYSTYFDGLASRSYEFVQGKLNLNADWTSLQNEMSSKGLKKYIAAYQTYYDRTK